MTDTKGRTRQELFHLWNDTPDPFKFVEIVTAEALSQARREREEMEAVLRSLLAMPVACTKDFEVIENNTRRSNARAVLDRITSGPSSPSPREAPNREGIARALYRSRCDRSGAITELDFEEYNRSPGGLDYLRMNVFAAYRDADAVIALLTAPQRDASPREEERERCVEIVKAVREDLMIAAGEAEFDGWQSKELSEETIAMLFPAAVTGGGT